MRPSDSEGGLRGSVATENINCQGLALVPWCPDTEERLRGYRWSSSLVYMGRAKQPGWLEVERILDCVGIDERRRGWGRAYEEYLEKNCVAWATERGRKELTGEWKAIRRGWCLGGDDFREELLESVGKKLKGKKHETYGGDEKRAHDERAASAWLEQGLVVYGLSGESLVRLKKCDKRKQVLGWWLSRRTSVGSDWVSEHLVMGHRTSVSKAAGLVERGKDPELDRLRRKLERTPRISD